MAIRRIEEHPVPDPLERVAESGDIPADRALKELLLSEQKPAPPRARESEERMVSIRLATERFGVLETLAARQGLAATTMARMLFHRALREAEQSDLSGP
jgi:hypothetical protein